MPSAPPSSELVSAIAEAAPARSGGAAAMIRSVLSVSAGATQRSTRTTRSPAPPGRMAAPAWVSSPKPSAASARPAATHQRRAEPAHQQRRQRRPGDEPGARRHQPQARPQRRHPQHQLQVLRNEEQDAEDHEDAGRLRGQGRAEGGPRGTAAGQAADPGSRAAGARTQPRAPARPGPTAPAARPPPSASCLRP